MRRIKINIRTIVKILLIPGLPLGIYYFFYGAGLLFQFVDKNIINIDVGEAPLVVEGFLFTVMICFSALIIGIVLWGMWCLAEKVLEPFDEYFTRRRLLATIASEEDARLHADEDRAYRQRIGVEEEDPRPRPHSSRGGVNTFG